MATSYTSILRLAQPAQGELSGTWGTVVNNNITAMIEEAIAGSATIDTWVTNSATLSTANGTTDEARPAILLLTDTTSDLTGSGTLIVPTATKQYICKNDTGETITVKTAAGTGVAISTGTTSIVFCDGTNVESAAGSLTNVVEDTTPQLGGNLDVNGSSIVSASAGDIAITPDTTGDIILDGQKWPQADGTANQLIETDGAGQLSWTSAIDGVTIGGTIPAAATVTTFTSTGIDDNATSTALTLHSDGLVSINTTDKSDSDFLNTLVHDGLEISSDTNEKAAVYNFLFASTAAGHTPNFSLYRARGTKASPTTVLSGDRTGLLWYGAYDGTDWEPTATIESYVDGTPSDGTDMPGRLSFHTTPDGSATRSERMRIHNDGKVSIGITDAPSYLQMRMWGGLSITEDTAYRASVYMEGYETASNVSPEIYVGRSRGSSSSQAVVQNGDQLFVPYSVYGHDGTNMEHAVKCMVHVDGVPASGGDTTDMPGRISWWTTPDASDTPLERMRITNEGDVRIGTTSDSSTIQGASSGSGMVITSAGVLSQTNPGIAMYINRNTSTGINIQFKSDGSSTGNISSNLTTTSYNATSDVRLKENIVDAPSAADVIDAVRVASFDWKETGEHQSHGFIAQELIDVVPQAVTLGETEEEPWGVDNGKLVPLLVKAVQELQAEIKLLKEQ